MTVALDVDDVLAAFTPHVFRYFRQDIEECDYWCVKGMAKRFGKDWFTGKISKDMGFWKTLPVLSFPEYIDFEFDYYISSFPEWLYDEREWWLARNKFPEKPLIHTMNKVEKCKELGVDLLIDDKPQTITECKEAGINTLHFIPYYAGFKPIGKYITSLKHVNTWLKKKDLDTI